MSSKKRRGRPKKVEIDDSSIDDCLSREDKELVIDAASILTHYPENQSLFRRSKRTKLKKTVESISDLTMISDDCSNGDHEFFPGEYPEDERDYDEICDIDAKVPKGIVELLSESKKKVNIISKKIEIPRVNDTESRDTGVSNLKDIKITSSLKIGKNKIYRSLKDLSSVKEKLMKIYGTNRDKLLGLAKQKYHFEKHVFDVPSICLESSFQEFEDIDSGIDIKDLENKLFSHPSEYTLITSENLMKLFPLDSSEKSVLIGDVDFALKIDEKADFPVFSCGNRSGFVYNVGGLITDMAWSQIPNTLTQFLAVSISNIDDPNNLKLKMLGKETHISVIEIYKFDSSNLSFTKYQTLVHNLGETWDLKWHPSFVSNDYIGIIGCACQDGTVNFFKVEKSDVYEIRKYDCSSLSINPVESYISCYDYTSSGSIVCGFQNGYLAEFELGLKMPYYYRKLHESYICSVVVASSPFEQNIIFTSAVDGISCAFNPLDIKSTKCTFNKNRGNNINLLAYIPQLYTLVYSDGISSVKALTPKAIFATHQVCQHENTISALGVSKIHPYLLSGSADGSIYLNNLVRRMLTGVRNMNSVYKYIKLWKWDYSKNEKKYRLDPTYEVYKHVTNETANIKIDPHGINIQAVKWNNIPQSGNFFAFANAAGFIVIEKLNE